MVAIQFEFQPSITDTINSAMKINKDLLKGLSIALKESSLEFNKGIKLANPQDTGHSRRAWGSPIQISASTYVVKNDVEYTPLIKYGRRKKSRWVATPQGVTINPGKSFKKVADEYFEVVAIKLSKRIERLLTEFWR